MIKHCAPHPGEYVDADLFWKSGEPYRQKLGVHRSRAAVCAWGLRGGRHTNPTGSLQRYPCLQQKQPSTPLQTAGDLPTHCNPSCALPDDSIGLKKGRARCCTGS